MSGTISVPDEKSDKAVTLPIIILYGEVPSVSITGQRLRKYVCPIRCRVSVDSLHREEYARFGQSISRYHHVHM